jgi:phage FluMu protein Com
MCPVCDHTLQRVNEGVSPVTYWCPRCGSLQTNGVPAHETPSYIRRLVQATSDRDAMRIVVEIVGTIGSTHEAQQATEAGRTTEARKAHAEGEQQAPTPGC